MSTAKNEARKNTEARRAQQSAPKGNSPEQRTHDETNERISAHDETTERETDTLYETEVENEVGEWRRHSDLDAPPARSGYVNRFIRIRLGVVRDTARLRNAIREGWRPVKASALKDDTLPTIHLDQYGDVIGVEDLILCEMPERVYKQRQAHFNRELKRQNAAIERQLQNASESANVGGFGPIQQSRSSSVSRPSRETMVADDE